MALLKENAAALPSGRAKRKDKWVCSDQARGKGLGGAMQHAAPPPSHVRTGDCRLAAGWCEDPCALPQMVLHKPSMNLHRLEAWQPAYGSAEHKMGGGPGAAAGG